MQKVGTPSPAVHARSGMRVIRLHDNLRAQPTGPEENDGETNYGIQHEQAKRRRAVATSPVPSGRVARRRRGRSRQIAREGCFSSLTRIRHTAKFRPRGSSDSSSSHVPLVGCPATTTSVLAWSLPRLGQRAPCISRLRSAWRHAPALRCAEGLVESCRDPTKTTTACFVGSATHRTPRVPYAYTVRTN
jgi:hypothetical protein